jgi:hypothetical protein
MTWLRLQFRRARKRSALLREFTPSPVDTAAHRDEIERRAGALTPDGVDEATGHALDRLIDSWADQWDATVVREYARYRLDQDLELAELRSRAAEAEVLHHDLTERAADLDLAVRSTRDALLGESGTDRPATNQAQP